MDTRVPRQTGQGPTDDSFEKNTKSNFIFNFFASLSNALAGLTVTRRSLNKENQQLRRHQSKLSISSSLSVSGTDIGRDEVADTDLRTSQVCVVVRPTPVLSDVTILYPDEVNLPVNANILDRLPVVESFSTSFSLLSSQENIEDVDEGIDDLGKQFTPD